MPKNNQKLQEVYSNGQSKALTFETHIVSQIINDTFKDVQNKVNSDDLVSMVEKSLEEFRKKVKMMQ